MAGKCQFKRGEYYQAVITRVEPSLEAAFVDYGDERHGYLPFASIAGFDSTIHQEKFPLVVCIDKESEGMQGAVVSAPADIPADIVVHDCEQTSPFITKLIFVLVFMAFVLLGIVIL